MPFILASVGKKGRNIPSDVRIVQNLLNKHVKVPFRLLTVDSKIGKMTIEAIERFQATFMSTPDGRVDSYGKTIQLLWPLEYAHPTGKPIRLLDDYGEGRFGAPRGHRDHDGSDYQVVPGQSVSAPLSGRVIRRSRPYRSGVDADVLSGVQIEASDGTLCWVWYITPTPGIVNKIVKAGDLIGIARTLKNRYRRRGPRGGMTDHIHVRIHKRNGHKINPATVIPSLWRGVTGCW